jgi:protein TonB
MGNQTMPEYESLDCETPQDKTQTGDVKHNRDMGMEPESLPFGQPTRRPETTGPAATMADDLLIQPESDSQAAAAVLDGAVLNLTFGASLEEKPIWADLYANIRDIFFPPKLPPLVLTSTPIPVPDRMAVKRNPVAVGISATFNAAIVLLLIFLGIKTIIKPAPPVTVTPVDITTDYQGPKAPSAAGGGGGSPDKSEAIKGKIPPRAKPLDMEPKLVQPPTPTIDVQKDIVIPDNPTLPNFGVSNSANVKLASGGNGSGMGLGSGSGDGYGPGTGGNIGGGLYHIGGGISAPVLLYSIDPEFSDEARRAKYQGSVTVSIIVDVHGNPQNPRVTHPLGMGLDEKAIEAIMKYKFKPALKDGKTPVPVVMNVLIDFHLY